MASYTKWKSIVDEYNYTDAIPDSVELQYFATNVTGGDTTWPDDNGVADMTLTGNKTDATLSDGGEALAFDGSTDFGSVTLPSTLEASSLNAFYIEFSTEYTFNSRCLGI